MVIDNKLLDLATRLKQYKGTFDTSFIETYVQAKWVYYVLFPEVPYKATVMLSDIADQMNVFEPVLEEVLKSFGNDSMPLWKKLSLALTSESELRNHESYYDAWTDVTARSILERKANGIKPKFIRLARNLTKLENELTWACFLGYPPITKNKFLTFLIKQRLEIEYVEASDLLSNLLSDNKSHFQILTMAMTDKNFYTYSKKKWFEMDIELKRRTYERWTGDDITDMKIDYQILPKDGITKMKCLNYEEKIWVEIDSEMKILDVIYFKHPELTLKSRLKKLSEEQDHLVINKLRKLKDVKTISDLLKYDPEHKEGVIRIPHNKKYNPNHYGGYILVKSSHLYDVRLNRVRKENGNIIIEVEALDGVDFFTIGEITTDRLTDKTVIWDAIKRQMIIENQDDCIIPDEICIVLSVSVLSFTKDVLPQMIDGYFMSIQYDKGIQDVVQMVDIMV